MAEPVILDGKKLAGEIRADLKDRVAKLGRKPALATILVGADPASATYVKMKGKACESIGMTSRRIELPATTQTDALLRIIDELNQDPDVHGILLQHPVPENVDERAAFDRIAASKDVDGVTTLGFGKISFGLDAYASCTPAGMIRLMDEYKIPIEGKHAVVVGRSPILGKPMALLLLERNATVTVCHSRTQNIEEHLAKADIVVAAVGKANFIKGASLKAGVVVMDAGYNEGNVGDADYESCYKKASHITPVPGGVGPMTIAMLLAHTVQAAEKASG
ncbi:MAG: tetrahydrofolate dehydrogenase/cyclohydrolase catalytic domain-containing protein [Leptospirales bacterium]|jgi:methylenetetrahydrofolate dehydrogenase (NADP+)/methenyltetrahydrofolate cyclohydrolase